MAGTWVTAAWPGEHDPRAHQFRVRMLGGPLDGSELYAMPDNHDGRRPRMFLILPVTGELESWERDEPDGDGVWQYHHRP